MSTLLTIKNDVANQLGFDNGATAVPKRDRIINRARRKFYSERRWSFLRKTDTLTFTSYLASLPSDYNKKFDPICVYTYSGNTKYEYIKVAWDDLILYGDFDYAYAVDKVNGQIKINQTASTLSIDYTYLPADKAIDTTDDTDIEPIENVEPIVLLSVALWWLASERSTAKYQLFMDDYREAKSIASLSDNASQPIKAFANRTNLIKTGYTGKGE